MPGISFASSTLVGATESVTLSCVASPEIGMMVEYTRYEIDEKRRRTFEEDYMKAGKFLEASNHCVAYELAHCTEDAYHYRLRIEWDSEDSHLKGFRNSREFASFFASVRPYVKDIEEMPHYQIIDAGHKRAAASSG